jgi:GAF domain-containing protein
MSQPSDPTLAMRMAELARALAAPQTTGAVLQEVTAAAVELIPGAHTAGILLIGKGGRFESLAGTDGVPHELDELQHTLQEGPCLDAAMHEDVVRTDDFRRETRWPAYSAAAQRIGVLSGLSFRLYTQKRTAGALNLFGYEATEWDDERMTVGSILAAQAVAALAATVESEQLRSAVRSRDRIGQAKGIIMERFTVDDVAAFDMLRRLSQEGNTPLIDIAQRVIDTRGE